jgi:hypothetical protein
MTIMAASSSDSSGDETRPTSLRIKKKQLEALDRIKTDKYHGLRSRASLINEAIWQFVDRETGGCNGNA